MMGKTNCENCLNYAYDEDFNCYECRANLDEDEMERFMGRSFDNCPYFKLDDEYGTVRKQI